MLKRIARLMAVSFILLGTGAFSAEAASCARHHTTGTVLGAAGGGVIGSVVTHGSPVGVIGGVVLGGLAGNAVARDSDRCRAHYGRRHYERRAAH